MHSDRELVTFRIYLYKLIAIILFIPNKSLNKGVTIVVFRVFSVCLASIPGRIFAFISDPAKIFSGSDTKAKIQPGIEASVCYPCPTHTIYS